MVQRQIFNRPRLPEIHNELANLLMQEWQQNPGAEL